MARHLGSSALGGEPPPPGAPHWMDWAWSRIAAGPRFFEHGWGDDGIIAQLEARADPFPVPQAPVIHWQGPPRRRGGALYRQGWFDTPFPKALLPAESHRAFVELILPHDDPQAPVWVHLAGAGDQGFGLRRRLWGHPLAQRGIGAVLLENPFYGARRPAYQRGVGLRHVTDQFVMNMATVEEACALLVWLQQQGHRKVGITGYSMGGYVSALVGALFPHEVGVVPCAAGHEPVYTFTEGLLSRLIAWERLGSDLQAAKERLGGWLRKAALVGLPVPRRPDASVLVAAQRDGYIHPDSVRALHAHWPGSQLRWTRGGHVSSILLDRHQISRALVDSLALL